MSDEIDKKGVSRIMADRSSRKLLLFAGGAVLIAVGYAVFAGSGKSAVDSSTVHVAPGLPGVQGKVPVPNAYANDIHQADNQKAAEAQHNMSKSATPTLVIPQAGGKLPGRLPGDDQEGPAIPAQAPATQVRPPVPVQAMVPMAPPPPRVAYDPGLTTNMVGALKKFAPTNPVAAQTIYFQDEKQGGKGIAGTAQSFASGMAGGGANGSNGPAAGQGAQTLQQAAAAQQGADSRFQAPAAGTILYSRLVGRVNSDTPGPVVAELEQGPFSGARLLGSFQFTEQGVIISFTTMTVPYTGDDGSAKSEVVPIHAVAVDTAHLGTAMATDIDRHILEKVGVAFGAAFLSGMGQAVSQSGSSAVVSPYGTTVTNPTLSTNQELLIAGGSAAGAAGQVFQQIYGNRRTTITVEADTPFGLLFLGNNSAGNAN
jgi:intracellular multiplication protein IcmE